MDMYFVYCLDENGYKIENRVTDGEHLDTCIDRAKVDWRVSTVHVNKASMCYDGYLVQGDYLGRK